MEDAILNIAVPVKHYKLSQTHGASLSHQQLETHGCIISTVATDALVLKHQGIHFHGADLISIALVQIHTEIL